MKTQHRSSVVAAGLLCLIAFANCWAQTDTPPTTAKVRERVNAIILQTMKRGEFTTAEGVKGITRVPPSNEDVEEIKRYGDRAIEPLEEHFASENGFEYELAMRFMGVLGGERIIGPFKKVILHDPSASKREYALRWITQGPWDQAARVISHAAEHDPDESVRKVAKELLSGHGK